jgi:hypothetical protein
MGPRTLSRSNYIPSDDAVVTVLGDLRLVVAEFGQNLVRVLAQAGRVPLNAERVAADNRRLPYIGERPGAGMLPFVEDLPRPQVRVADYGWPSCVREFLDPSAST